MRGGDKDPLRLVEYVDHKESCTQAYFAVPEAAPSELFVACRGTESMSDWVTDARFLKMLFEPASDSYEEVMEAGLREVTCCNWSGRPLVHRGSYRCLLVLKDALRRHCDMAREGGLTKLTFVGHSLGGMIAVQAFVYALQLISLGGLVVGVSMQSLRLKSKASFVGST
jgi:hypothetical protein